MSTPTLRATDAAMLALRILGEAPAYTAITVTELAAMFERIAAAGAEYDHQRARDRAMRSAYDRRRRARCRRARR